MHFCVEPIAHKSSPWSKNYKYHVLMLMLMLMLVLMVVMMRYYKSGSKPVCFSDKELLDFIKTEQ